MTDIRTIELVGTAFNKRVRLNASELMLKKYCKKALTACRAIGEESVSFTLPSADCIVLEAIAPLSRREVFNVTICCTVKTSTVSFYLYFGIDREKDAFFGSTNPADFDIGVLEVLR